MYQFSFQKNTLTSKRNTSVTFNASYSLNSHLNLLTEFTFWHNPLSKILKCYVLYCYMKSYRPFYTATPWCNDYWLWTKGPDIFSTSFRSPYNEQMMVWNTHTSFAVQDVQFRNVSMRCCERQRNKSFGVIATISLTDPNVAKSWKQDKF